MKQEKYLFYTVEDFILDKDFMQWVLHPNHENEKFWSTFLQQHPEKKNHIKEAAQIIKSVQVVEPSVSNQRLNEIYNKIKVQSAKPRTKILVFSRYAAILFFILSIGGVIYFFHNKQSQFPIELAEINMLEKSKIILPDGSVNEFDNEVTEIQQSSTRELTVNNDTISLTQIQNSQNLAQVIIPYGKRSEILLSDGTKIWLNSGSQFSYPITFTGNSREVYLSGEAFFDVKSNQDKPFYVITEDLKIQVTGTRFNVTSYSNDRETQAVLLSGKIDAAKNKRFTSSIELSPGERIVYNKVNDVIKKDKVDVELYSSWINGYLIFENEPLENIFRKLERYYNKTIITTNPISPGKFTGKLNLTENLENVLKNISYSAGFSVNYENEKFMITQ